MLSIIAIVMWIVSQVSTYPELGQIQNWPKNCTISPSQVELPKGKDAIQWLNKIIDY